MSEQQPTEQVRIRKKRFRKKKRWPKILLWTLSIVVILGAGGLFAANYAIDKFLAQMASELDMGDLTANAGSESEQPGGSEADPVGGDGAIGDAAQPDSGSTEGGTGGSPGSGDGDLAAGGTEGSSDPGTAGSGGESTPAGGGTSDEDLDGYSAEITPDKAQHVQDSVTIGDKSKVAAIVLSQLSMEDIKRLQELSSGGLTVEEKREAKKLILEKFSPEQYDEVIEVAQRYGLSQGKNYEESQKEDLGGS
ncbi:hypothetical protein [Paenibacillus sp. 1P07SE]|uniref:hypothetical protein n=1 Tax=Paenibacillus sp. 1P07SE TaxID=3132209 RepID=UPI0039A7675D